MLAAHAVPLCTAKFTALHSKKKLDNKTRFVLHPVCCLEAVTELPLEPLSRKRCGLIMFYSSLTITGGERIKLVDHVVQ